MGSGLHYSIFAFWQVDYLDDFYSSLELLVKSFRYLLMYDFGSTLALATTIKTQEDYSILQIYVFEDFIYSPSYASYVYGVLFSLFLIPRI